MEQKKGYNSSIELHYNKKPPNDCQVDNQMDFNSDSDSHHGQVHRHFSRQALDEMFGHSFVGMVVVSQDHGVAGPLQDQGGDDQLVSVMAEGGDQDDKDKVEHKDGDKDQPEEPESPRPTFELTQELLLDNKWKPRSPPQEEEEGAQVQNSEVTKEKSEENPFKQFSSKKEKKGQHPTLLVEDIGDETNLAAGTLNNNLMAPVPSVTERDSGKKKQNKRNNLNRTRSGSAQGARDSGRIISDQEPIQINAQILGNQTITKPDQTHINQDQLGLIKKSTIKTMPSPSKTRKSNTPLSALFSQFKFTPPSSVVGNGKVGKNISIIDQKEKWIRLQEHNRYHDETCFLMESIKDVMRQRVQFNKETQKAHMKLKVKLEKSGILTHAEIYKHNHKTINIQNSHKSKLIETVARPYEEGSDFEEEEQQYSWKMFVEMYEESMAHIHDETSFWVHGKIVKFSKDSLGIFNNKTKFRFGLVFIVTSKRFENLIIFLIMVNSIVLGVKDYTDFDNETSRNQYIEEMEPFFMYSFIIECLLKIFAMGFIMGSNTYLSEAWNWLDFIVVVSSLLEQLPGMGAVSGLRTFRLFRPLRSLTTMPSMQRLVGTLMASLSQLGNIMGLAFFFFMIFAILGVSLLDGRTHWRCYQTELPDAITGLWEVVPSDRALCSADSRQCPDDPKTKKPTFCGSKFEIFDLTNNKYKWKEEDLGLDTQIEEFNYNLTNFDNLGSAFLTIFQCITMEGWTKIMNMYMDAYQSIFSALFFVLCVLICSFFLLNLTIAVMLMKYEELDKTQENSTHQQELKQLGIAAKLPTPLIQFFLNQNNIQIQPEAYKILQQEDSFIKQLFAVKQSPVDISEAYYQRPIVKKAYDILMHPYFDSSIILAILLNTISLATDRDKPYPQWFSTILQILNYIFTIVFTAEALIKMVGLGLKAYIRDKMNRFDIIIVLASLAELGQSSDGPGVFSSVRAFRLFKIFRLFKAGDLRILIDSIIFTLGTIGDYVILLVLFIYVFALLGMSQFAGKVKFNDNDIYDLENGEAPRENFDGLGWTIITIFQVLLGEGWNDIMYTCMRAEGSGVSIYYVMLVAGGNIVMLNLFLAILLGNFDKARNFGQKKKVFEAFKEIIESGITLNDAVDIILGDMAFHVKTKVLKWDKKEAMKISKEGAGIYGHAGCTEIVAAAAAIKKVDANKLALPEDEVKNNLNNSDLLINSAPRKVENEENEPQLLVQRQKTTTRANTLPEYMVKNQLELTALKGTNGQKINNVPIDSGNRKRESSTGLNKLEKYHKKNPKIMRLKELNKVLRLKPFAGLQEIIDKKDYDGEFKYLPLPKNETLADCNKRIKQQQYINEEEVITDRKSDQSSKSSKSLDKEGEEQDNQIYNQKPKTRSNSIHGGVNRKSLKSSRTSVLSIEQTSPTNKERRRKSLKLTQTKSVELTNLRVASKPNGDGVTDGQAILNIMNNVSRKEFIDIHSIPKRKITMMDSLNQSDVIGGEQFPTQQQEKLAFKQRSIAYAMDSSMFIFHKDSTIRKWCLQLVEDPAILNQLAEMLNQDKEIDENNTSSIGVGKKTNNIDSMAVDKLEGILKGSKKVQQKFNPNHQFEKFILYLIIFSSVMLIIDNPLYDQNSQFMQVLGYIDLGFTALFFMECAIKIIAKGFFRNKLGPVIPYISNSWNQLDFFVVLASLVDLTLMLLKVDMTSLAILKALRSLRALRPLRVISKDEGMKLVVMALMASIPSMSNVLLVCSLFILIYSIMGVNYFKGSFYSCANAFEKAEIDMSKIFTKKDCLDKGGVWKNKDANFDNSFDAMSTLFQMMTTEGWVATMYDGIDSTGNGMQPKQNSQLGLVIYFMSFMIVGSQFIINLFVGVVIDNFNTIKEKEELGNMFVTEEQRSWIEIQKVGQGRKLTVKMHEPKGYQKKFYSIVNHPSNYFDHTITFFIFINTCVMAMKHYRQSDSMIEFAEQANMVFAVVFNIEMFMKLLALRKTYFRDSWNKFDMIVVIATDAGITLKIMQMGDSFASISTVIRGVRILRMFKLIRSSVHMRLILDTVFNILPQIGNVMSLIVLLFFIYASLGTNLFSGVQLQDNLDDKNNFQNFPNAMILLMRFSTGEDWNYFMYELANDKGYNGVDCVKIQNFSIIQENGGEKRQCGSLFAYPYMISFTVIVSMLIMNLSVAAVIEGLDNAKKENMGIVQGDTIDEFIEIWQDYDPNASGWITLESLVFLLYELPPPMGRVNKFEMEEQPEDLETKRGLRQQERYFVNNAKGIVIKKKYALELLKDLKIKVYPDAIRQIHFIDVFKGLMKRILMDAKMDYKVNNNLQKKIKTQWHKKHKPSENKQKTNMTVYQQQAGVIITEWARKMIETQKNHYKLNKDKKKAGVKKPTIQEMKNQQQHPNDAISRKEARVQLYQEQADIIFKIIKGVKDEDEMCEHDIENNYKTKNVFSWKKPGGELLLENLNKNDSEDSSVDINVNMKDSERHKAKEAIKEEKERVYFLNKKESVPEMFSDSLFGPNSQLQMAEIENKKKETHDISYGEGRIGQNTRRDHMGVIEEGETVIDPFEYVEDTQYEKPKKHVQIMALSDEIYNHEQVMPVQQIDLMSGQQFSPYSSNYGDLQLHKYANTGMRQGDDDDDAQSVQSKLFSDDNGLFQKTNLQ